MRMLIALVCVVGCGRLHIDRVPADADVDELPTPCTVDGVACDDRNICTATSTCRDAMCVAPPVGTCEVADSAVDYMTVQGDRGWYYGYWILSSDPDATYSATDFRELVYAAPVWRPPDYEDTGNNFSWAYLAGWGGHPGSYPMQKLPVRRWLSDVSGAAEAVIHLAKADTSSGDGVRAELYVDSAKIWSRAVAFDDAVGFTEAVPIELAVGTTVDLLLHYVDDDASDATDSTMIIRSR